MLGWTLLLIYTFWRDTTTSTATDTTSAPQHLYDFAASSIEYVRRHKSDLEDL
eukprot:m.22669 g.22669  ORF g.22669 m.22669 type:complete len:53 (-) comp12778_c0_seq1:82-240(-)